MALRPTFCFTTKWNTETKLFSSFQKIKSLRGGFRNAEDMIFYIENAQRLKELENLTFFFGFAPTNKCFDQLACIQKLQSLEVTFKNEDFKGWSFIQNFAFPVIGLGLRYLSINFMGVLYDELFLLELSDAIGVFHNLTYFTLAIADPSCHVSGEFFKRLGQGLAQSSSLQSLSLSYVSVYTEDSHYLFEGIAKMKNLISLILSISLEEEAAEPLGACLAQMQVSQLDIALNPYIVSDGKQHYPTYYVTPSMLKSVIEGIKKIKTLQHLNFQLGYTKAFTKKDDSTAISEMILGLENVMILNIFIEGKYLNKTELKSIYDNIQTLKDLKSFELRGHKGNIVSNALEGLVKLFKNLKMSININLT